MDCWASIRTVTFGTTRTAELSALRAGRILPPRNSLVLISVTGSASPRATECVQELGNLKISKDPTGNQTRGLPLYGTVPQPNAPPLAAFNENRSYFPGLNRPGREII